MELEEELELAKKTNNEKEMRLNLMKVSLSNIQNDVKKLRKLEQEVNDYKNENTVLMDELVQKKSEVIKLSRELFERTRELAEPKSPIVRELVKDDFEEKYKELLANHSELIKLYNEKSNESQRLQLLLEDGNKKIIENQRSLENIQMAVHKYKTESIRLKERLK